MPDMSITVGHVIDNPTFDTELAYRIGYWDEDQNDWIRLFDSRQTDDNPPVELLVKKIRFMTIVDDQLVLEVRR